jgi:hypothetical protein
MNRDLLFFILHNEKSLALLSRAVENKRNPKRLTLILNIRHLQSSNTVRRVYEQKSLFNVTFEIKFTKYTFGGEKASER